MFITTVPEASDTSRGDISSIPHVELYVFEADPGDITKDIFEVLIPEAIQANGSNGQFNEWFFFLE